jgi:hypothetical protein
MDADDFAQHKLSLDRLLAVIFQSDDLGDPAFEVDRTLFEVDRTFSVTAWLERVSGDPPMPTSTIIVTASPACP